MADKQSVTHIEIHARKGQIEVFTRQRGQSRHTHYPSLNQVPPELRGEALTLIRSAFQHAGYDSLAELDAALTSELVVPEKKEEKPEAAKPARTRPAKSRRM